MKFLVDFARQSFPSCLASISREGSFYSQRKQPGLECNTTHWFIHSSLNSVDKLWTSSSQGEFLFLKRPLESVLSALKELNVPPPITASEVGWVWKLKTWPYKLRSALVVESYIGWRWRNDQSVNWVSSLEGQVNNIAYSLALSIESYPSLYKIGGSS